MAHHIFLCFTIVVVICCLSVVVQSFVPKSLSSSCLSKHQYLSMEYIPDGLSKDQWKELKKREEEELKKKQMGALGTTKFKSRSFEAWQKAGAKHLFPVDPATTSYEERPYMQRKNGDWEGKDLKQLGLVGKGQGTASKRVNLDNLYDDAAKEGKL